MSIADVTSGKGRFYVTSASVDAIRAAAGEGWRVVVLDGASMATKEGLMSSLAGALAFPDHFGANWDALADSLGELAWSDDNRLLLVIDDADAALSEAPTQREILFDVLAHAFDDADGDGPDAELRICLRATNPDASSAVAAAREAGIAVAHR